MTDIREPRLRTPKILGLQDKMAPLQAQLQKLRSEQDEEIAAEREKCPHQNTETHYREFHKSYGIGVAREAIGRLCRDCGALIRGDCSRCGGVTKYVGRGWDDLNLRAEIYRCSNCGHEHGVT